MPERWKTSTKELFSSGWNWASTPLLTVATTAAPLGKNDKVSFVVTHIDEDRNVAVGIITRIIKQYI